MSIICSECGKPLIQRNRNQKYHRECVRKRQEQQQKEYYNKRQAKKAESRVSGKERRWERACAVCGMLFIPRTHNGRYCPKSECRKKGIKIGLEEKKKRLSNNEPSIVIATKDL